MTYQFKKATPEDVPVIFDMILQRMKWMDEQGIQQWNVTNYDQVFPLSYYQQMQQDGHLFVLTNQHNHIICGVVLKETDENWDNQDPALYISRFVSQLHVHAGSICLKYIEDYAKKLGKHYLRLDSADDNIKLAKYYKSHGFEAMGTCQEGSYHGILRQKKIV